MKLSKLFKTLALTTIFAISSQAMLLVQQNKALAGAGTPTLSTNEVLYPGQSIVSPNGQFTAILQGDGNFVLYNPDSTPRWNSGTAGNYSVQYLAMQNDCNLVIYVSAPGGNLNPTFRTNTVQGVGSNCRLQMQDDGNLVLYRGNNVPLWVNGRNLIQSSVPKKSNPPVGFDDPNIIDIPF